MPLRGSDRVAFVGKTGSGKTYAARLLLAHSQRLVVCDPKGTLRGKWGLAEWSAKTRRALANGKPVRVRIPAAIGDIAHWEKLFALCMQAGNVTVYIDEVYGVLDAGNRPGAYLTALYTRGRELGIGVWAATQRPSWIPLFVLSEAEWFLAFRLQLEADAKRVGSLIGVDADALTSLKGHSFYLYNSEWEQAELYSTIKEV